MEYMLHFHGKNGCTNAPQCYIMLIAIDCFVLFVADRNTYAMLSFIFQKCFQNTVIFKFVVVRILVRCWRRLITHGDESSDVATITVDSLVRKLYITETCVLADIRSSYLCQCSSIVFIITYIRINKNRNSNSQKCWHKRVKNTATKVLMPRKVLLIKCKA